MFCKIKKGEASLKGKSRVDLLKTFADETGYTVAKEFWDSTMKLVKHLKVVLCLQTFGKI